MAKDINNITKTVGALIKDLSPRNRDIISRRFGLKNGHKETLESIGQSYGITRERVRQIEEFALKQLSKSAQNSGLLEPHIITAKATLAKSGGVMTEDDLFKSVTGSSNASAVNSSLAFVLTLSGQLSHIRENDHYKSVWAQHDIALDAFKSSVASLASAVKDSGSVLSEEDLLAHAEKKNVCGINGEFCDSDLKIVLSGSKVLSKNIFGQVGLASWSEVKPRGVRDKAYLILKKEKTPKHFTEIAKLINTTGFGGKKANTQTVHNELIKDTRFVLVGRGMYALSEWGYKSGTVKDVLVDILKSSSQPLTKADLTAKVMDARMVKENTILLNLQDSKVFRKNEDGTYGLRKA